MKCPANILKLNSFKLAIGLSRQSQSCLIHCYRVKNQTDCVDCFIAKNIHQHLFVLSFSALSLAIALSLSLSLSCYLTLSLTLSHSLSLSRSLSLSLFSQKAQNTKKHLWWKKSELKWAGKKCLSEWQPWWCDATVMVWRSHDGATLAWWPDVTEKIRQVTFMPSISVRLNMRLKLRWLRPQVPVLKPCLLRSTVEHCGFYFRHCLHLSKTPASMVKLHAKASKVVTL